MDNMRLLSTRRGEPVLASHSFIAQTYIHAQGKWQSRGNICSEHGPLPVVLAQKKLVTWPPST